MTSRSRISNLERGAIRTRERGAATLIVVMVLFFIVSMVAAYTSRNLIFEQKTSGNQYRSTAALEAADAGLQWAIGLLNSGRITADCQPTVDLTQTTFRDRYLAINATSGAITVPTPLFPSCVFDGTNWTCGCPTAASPGLTLAAPTGVGIFPAFRARFLPYTSGSSPGVTGIVKIEVNGCTRYADSCLNFPASGEDNEGRVKVSALLMLKGGVTTAPAAALTARGNVDLGSVAPTIANSSPSGSGVTVQAGGVLSNFGSATFVTTPGSSPAGSYVQSDASLSALTADRMFSNTFGMAKATYSGQPGAVSMACPCTSAAVAATAAQNPGRVLWLTGDLTIDSDLGTASDPLTIVTTGNVQFTGAANVFGLIYTQAATWNTGAGTGQINGAAIAEGNVTGTTTATIAYDADVLTRVRYRTGSFVMMPASWKDFE